MMCDVNVTPSLYTVTTILGYYEEVCYHIMLDFRVEKWDQEV